MRTTRTTVPLLLVAMLWLGAQVSAHHSFASFYLEDQTITVEGDVVEFDYRSPHSWLSVMAKTDSGELQKFSAEWAAAPRLTRSGITAETVKPGDHVILTGAPGRKASERHLHLKTIERPADGWSWRGGPEGPRGQR